MKFVTRSLPFLLAAAAVVPVLWTPEFLGAQTPVRPAPAPAPRTAPVPAPAPAPARAPIAREWIDRDAMSRAVEARVAASIDLSELSKLVAAGVEDGAASLRPEITDWLARNG